MWPPTCKSTTQFATHIIESQCQQGRNLGCSCMFPPLISHAVVLLIPWQIHRAPSPQLCLPQSFINSRYVFLSIFQFHLWCPTCLHFSSSISIHDHKSQSMLNSFGITWPYLDQKILYQDGGHNAFIPWQPVTCFNQRMKQNISIEPPSTGNFKPWNNPQLNIILHSIST